VIWPGGRKQVEHNLNVNQQILIIEDTAGDNSTSIEPIWNKNQSFKVVPNPNSGNFNITFFSTSTMPTLVRILDLQGRELYFKYSDSTTIGKSNISVSLPKLNSGLYVLEVINGSDKFVSKISIHDK